jgi:hypothetical protein
MNPIMIPIIRKQLPRLIAQDILGVQPMSSPHKKKYWPYQATVKWNEIKQIERWCYSCMKSGNWRSSAFTLDAFFAFKTSKTS